MKCPKCQTNITYSNLDPSCIGDVDFQYLPDMIFSIAYFCPECDHIGNITYGIKKIE